ncbi:MAG: hypothetical protein AB1420_11615 [Bacillota bacterium]
MAAFSAIFYYLLEGYGCFKAIPANLRIILFVLIGLSSLGIGCLKSRNFLYGARKIGVDMTFYKLLKELYTPRFQALPLPNITVIVLVIIYLGSRGNYHEQHHQKNVQK